MMELIKLPRQTQTLQYNGANLYGCPVQGFLFWIFYFFLLFYLIFEGGRKGTNIIITLLCNAALMNNWAITRPNVY